MSFSRFVALYLPAFHAPHPANHAPQPVNYTLQNRWKSRKWNISLIFSLFTLFIPSKSLTYIWRYEMFKPFKIGKSNSLTPKWFKTPCDVTISSESWHPNYSTSEAPEDWSCFLRGSAYWKTQVYLLFPPFHYSRASNLGKIYAYFSEEIVTSSSVLGLTWTSFLFNSFWNLLRVQWMNFIKKFENKLFE